MHEHVNTGMLAVRRSARTDPAHKLLTPAFPTGLARLH